MPLLSYLGCCIRRRHEQERIEKTIQTGQSTNGRLSNKEQEKWEDIYWMYKKFNGKNKQS